LLLAGNFDYKLQTYRTNFLGGRLCPYRSYGNRFQLRVLEDGTGRRGWVKYKDGLTLFSLLKADHIKPNTQ
jgi:hypothetical protein